VAIALSVQRLQKSYAGRELFREISFGLEDGERVGLLGPNGAGKSTLLKILAKNERPDSGDVVYRKGLRVAYLAQSPQFQPEDSIQSLLLNNYDMDSEQLSRAFEWIGKVGLSDLNFESPILELSGGWQKRVSLAQELMKNPDLLLLDEPTNHLDVLGIKWLEEFLQDAKLTCLMVTHDRLFLQRTCLRILDLDPQFPGQILSVPGTYSKYIETKTNMRAEQMVRETKLSNTLRREMEWLARGAKARQTKQQARQQSAADLGQEVGRLNNLNRDRSLQMSFGANEKGPQKLIQAQNLGQELGGRSLFKNLDMVVTVKTRVGLLGPNGAGKSTLIKTLLGILPPVEGRALMAEKLSVNYFEQNRDTLNPELSVRKNLCPEGDYVDFRGTFVHVRSYLDKFRFFKDRADLPVHRLSGGEQARLRIAQLMLKESKILVLDEPTNDLDLETLQILQQALEEFPGAVILVSHDRYFMDQVCSEILAFHPGTDQLIMFADYLQWEEWYDKNPPLQATAKSNEAAATSASAHEKTTPEKPKEKPKSKPLTFTEKFDLEKMEEKSKGLEQDVHRAQEKLAALSSQPVTAELGQKIAKATQELASAQEKLEQLLERWADLDQRSKI
jgi:ATP-binding cassette subfamily F protein uup